VALLLALFTCLPWAKAVHAQPVDAGEEPSGRPIVYNLIPTQDAIVAQEELARAGATIEAQRDVGVARATVFIDGELRPSALMGPTRCLQSVSTDVGDLSRGTHSIRVVAVDSEGRAGGYAWTFTVV
jgi:hypothetical protein